MSRKALPYIAKDRDEEYECVVGGLPSMATRDHFHAHSMDGLRTIGVAKLEIPIRHPWAGQGAKFPAFPKVLPSDVAPDFIVKPVLIAMNLFSPFHHSNPLSGVVPPRALDGRPKPPKPNLAKRGTGGNYTIPSPLGIPTWMNSQQWLASRQMYA